MVYNAAGGEGVIKGPLLQIHGLYSGRESSSERKKYMPGQDPSGTGDGSWHICREAHALSGGATTQKLFLPFQASQI